MNTIQKAKVTKMKKETYIKKKNWNLYIKKKKELFYPSPEENRFNIMQNVHSYADLTTKIKHAQCRKDAKTNHQKSKAVSENNLKAENPAWETKQGWTQSSSWLFISFTVWSSQWNRKSRIKPRAPGRYDMCSFNKHPASDYSVTTWPYICVYTVT